MQSKGLLSLLQHHSSKASILLRPAFFMVQLSHPYMTTGKTIALTRRTFAGKGRTSAAERSYPGPEGRGGDQEELTRSRGKEQWLRFAGAAVKRDCMSKVRETQVRW